MTATKKPLAPLVKCDHAGKGCGYCRGARPHKHRLGLLSSLRSYTCNRIGATVCCVEVTK